MIITAVSGLILLGVGHLFIRKNRKAILLIVATLVLSPFLGIIPLPVSLVTAAAYAALYVYQLFDVWKLTERQII